CPHPESGMGRRTQLLNEITAIVNGPHLSSGPLSIIKSPTLNMNKPIYLVLLGLVMASCAQQARMTTPSTGQAFTPGIVKPVDYNYPTDSSFKILSWNVENFVDLLDDPYIQNRRENNPPEDTEQRISLLVQALRAADADVV